MKKRKQIKNITFKYCVAVLVILQLTTLQHNEYYAIFSTLVASAILGCVLSIFHHVIVANLNAKPKVEIKEIEVIKEVKVIEEVFKPWKLLPQEQETLDNWKKTLPEFRDKEGKLSNNYSFDYIYSGGSGIGISITVRRTDGFEIDVTDYSTW